LAFVVDPLIIHARCSHGDRPGAAHDGSLLGLAVANDQDSAVLVALEPLVAAVSQRMSAALIAPAGTGKSALLRALCDRLPAARYRGIVREYLEHGWRVLSSGYNNRLRVFDYAEGYAAFLNSSIHDFCLYLRHFADSFITVRRSIACVIATWLPRCPCCHRDNALDHTSPQAPRAPPVPPA